MDLTKKHRSERGNVFFALFGAVAVVGVIGAASMSIMRGPLTTMVAVNKQTQAESQMQLISRLAVIEAINNPSGEDCDADGEIEPVLARDPGAVTAPTNGGLVPNSFGTEKTDPWGTEYGYCVWDAGNVVADAGCAAGAGEVALLAGKGNDANDYTVISIISAGPDRVFDTTCNTFAVADADNSNDIDGSERMALKTAGSDDIVFDATYQEASSFAGGLWTIKTGEPTTATTDREVEVTQAARFGAALDLQTLSGSLLLPDQVASGACNSAANEGMVRRNTTTTPPTLEICDYNGGAGAGWIGVSAGATDVSRISDDDIGLPSPTEVEVNDTTATITFDVSGTEEMTINATTLDAGSLNITTTGTLGAGATTVSTLNATAGVDFDTTLDVQGNVILGDAATDTVVVTGLLTASETVTISNTAGADPALAVTGDITGVNVDLTGALTLADGQPLQWGDGTVDITGSSAGDTLAIDAATTTLNGAVNITNAATADPALNVTGNIDLSGDLTVAGDDIVMGTNTTGFVMVADGTNFNPVAMSGDATIIADGTVTLSNASVDYNNLDAAGAIADELCLKADGTTGLQWQTCSAGAGGGDGVGTDGLNDLSDVTIATPADGHILVYDDTTDDEWENVLMSGDATISRLGALTIADDAVTSAKIADNTILPINLADPAVAGDDEFCLTYEHSGATLEWQTCGGGALALDGLSDVVAAGATSGNIIKFDGTNWVLSDDLGGDFLFTGNLNFSASVLGTWTLQGNTLAAGAPNGNAARIDTNTVVVARTVGINPDTLQAYSWDGTNWVAVGNSFNLPGGSNHGINGLQSLSANRVAYYGRYIGAYDFDGTDWTLVGNTFDTGEFGAGGTLTVLDSNTIAFYVTGGSDELRTYSFDGTNWSQDGNSLAIAGAELKLAALDSNTIAIYDVSNGDLSTYNWNGSDWSQTGNTLTGLASFGHGAGEIRALDSTSIAVTYNNNLLSYRWDGTDWTVEGGSSTATQIGGGIAVLDSNTLAATDVNGDLSTFQRSSGASTIDDDDTNGTLGGLLSANDRFRVTGSVSNDRIYTVAGITNADTIQVVEGTITEGPVAAQISLIDSVSALDNLVDVDVPTPANGQFLSYNSTTTNWEATTFDGASSIPDDSITAVKLAISNAEADELCLTYEADAGGSLAWQACSAGGSLNDLSDVVAAGATSGDVIKFDGTNWVLSDDLGGDFLFTGNLNFSANSYGNWGQSGNTNDVRSGSNGGNSITFMSSTRIAYSDANDHELVAFDWDGTDWNQVGTAYTGFTAVASGANNIEALNATDVVIVADSQIRVMRFDGSTWSQVGTGAAVGSTYQRLAVLDSSTIVYSAINGVLQVYSWNGSNLSTVGSTFDPTNGGPIEALDSNTIAVISPNIDELRTFNWNGSTWNQVGNTLSAAHPFYDSSIAKLSSNSILIRAANGTNGIFNTYTWDGTDWSLTVANVDDIVGIWDGWRGIAAYNDTFVAGLDLNSTNGLTTMARTSGAGSIDDDDTNGTLGGLLSANDRFRVTGSTSNDGIYTVSTVVNADTIQVVESTITEGPVAAQISLIDSVSALDNLVDVDVATPSNGQFLSYNSTTTNWEATTFDGASSIPDDSITAVKLAISNAEADELCLTYESDAGGSLAWQACSAGGSSALNDLSDVVAAGATNGDVIKFDGTNWVLSDDLGGDFIFSGDLVFNSIVYGAWGQQGTSLSVTDDQGQIAALSSTRIVHLDDDDDTMTTYDWNGTTWVQVGSSFAITLANPGQMAITELDGSTVAVANGAQDLTTYSFNGSTWSQVGSAANNIFSSINTDIDRLDNNTVVSKNGNAVVVHSWDGSTWSTVGSTLTTSSFGGLIAALDNNTIAILEGDTDELETYDWNGSTWSQVGASLATGVNFSNDRMEALSANMVVIANEVPTYTYYVYIWDGSTWSLDSTFAPNSPTYQGMAALDENTLVVNEWFSSELTNYTRSAGTPTIEDNDTNNTLGGLVGLGDRIRVRGSTSNDGVYTVSSVVSANEIGVSEAVVAGGPEAAQISFINSVTALDGLVDVHASGAANGQCIVYNSVLGGWEPATCSNWTSDGSGNLTNSAGGRVGIGAMPGAGYELDVTGDLNVSGTTTNVSDRRMKKDIELLNSQEMSENLLKINTYKYRKINDVDQKIEYGVLAQELEELFPDLVHTSEDEMKTKAVNYTGLILPLIENAKMLKLENDALHMQLADLKMQQTETLAALQGLKTDVSGLKIHTGLGVEQANNWQLMLLMMLFGGVCVFVFGRLKRT